MINQKKENVELQEKALLKRKYLIVSNKLKINNETKIKELYCMIAFFLEQAEGFKKKFGKSVTIQKSTQQKYYEDTHKVLIEALKKELKEYETKKRIASNKTELKEIEAMLSINKKFESKERFIEIEIKNKIEADNLTKNIFKMVYYTGLFVEESNLEL